MSRQVVGRILPGKAEAFDETRAYAKLDRVVLAGTTWECVAACEAGQGPEQAPDNWVIIGNGVTAASIDELKTKADAAYAQATNVNARVVENTEAAKTAQARADKGVADAATA